MIASKRHIALIFSLLLLGGMSQEAWAKVTYHILSLPISTKQLDGTDHQAGTLQNFRTNVRVEVLRCVSSTLTVGLPFEYKSPLVTTYHYYASDKITRSANPEQLYGYNSTQYYFYTINGSLANEDVPGNQLTAGDDCADNIDIYVTYDYDPATSSIDLSTTMDEGTRLLSTSKVYNIHLKDRMVVLNQVRQNRPGAVLDGYYTPEQLSSNDFEWIAKEGLNNSTGYRHFAFKFGGNDPYNVTVFTAFDKNYTYRGTGQANFYTEFKKDKDKYTQKDVYKEYRGASFFSLMGAEITANMWLSSEANIQWQESGTANNAVGKTVPGYYKGPNDNKSTLYEMSPIFNSFAILNHKSGEGWALAGSKMNHGTQNWQPRASDGLIQYMDYKDNGNNIIIVYKAEASACKVDVYEVKEYVFRVQTPFGNNVDVVGKWSDYAADETITADMVPDALKRKYVNFTGSFYADAAHNTAVTTFADAQTSCSKDASDRPIIYVGYEVSGAPFTAITAANKTGGYTTATWYELTDKDSSGKKIKWDATNSVYKNNGGTSEYVKESEFAFIGDPYELRIINRQLTVANSRNFYVGSSSQTTGTDLTNFDSDSGTETAGFKWEIPYDETLGSFTLREFGSTDAYWQWSTTEGNTIQYSTSASTRIKVMEIGKVNYTFKVVDLAGNVAIQATAELTPFTSLTGTGVCYSLIPSAIRSPFLADETVKFYDSYTDRNSDSKTDRKDWHNPSEQTALTELPGTASDIYVAYTTAKLSSKNIKLLYNEQFNVKLNGEYIYWSSSDNKILSKANPTTAELESGAYLWHLRGRDPYSMRIDNVGYSATLGSPLPDISVTIYETAGDGTSHPESVKNGMFVRVDGGTWGDNKALTWTSDRDQASRFIAMMSNNVGVYEVLAATGTSDYYRIGRASTTGAETKIYSDATFAHGADQLRFELAGTETITYHLIDKSGNEIFTDEITSKNPRLTLPSEYVSPLVEEYYYYPTRAKATSDLSGDRITEIADDTNESGGARDDHVYVRYKVKEDFGFGTSYPRLLKFLNPLEEGYYLEDGADKLTGSKLKAIYPYCNGDGNLNIYGTAMNEEQMNGGSSTRPRWVWFIESATSDPYHVKIHSKSTISFGGGSHTTYLQTQAVHFNQDANANLKHIVTGACFPGISLQPATEYMILGTTGHYKLVTSAKIAADLDGDGDTTDDGENERRTVTSFEQYWKTYNMIKQHLLGIDCAPSGTDPYKDENSTETSTFIVPTELRATLRAALDTKGIGGSNWHSYDAIANAVRWNGYNAAGKRNSKLVEKLEHWFQTFDMGNGEFDIEDADIPPVLVLLDRHGWEIMRKPLPTSSSDPQRDEKLAALRAFDSPMVKKYKFYNNASKDSDCHRYVLRMQNGAERDPIKLNGKQYTSTSLADLPPLTASGVVSSGTINDQFVTYTVKEEYDSSYNPSTGTASTFLVLQNDKYAQANGSTIDGKSVPASGLSAMIIDPDDTADSNSDGNIDDVNLWYVQPNSAIDTEMGYPATNTTPTYTDAQNGFDPYNVQLKNASTGKFFTIHMTQSVLNGGAYTGVYSGEGGSSSVTLADACTSPVASPESYDHSTLQMTNQTFMAVQDENGNLQLMPRFDNTTRINVFTTLATPLTAPAGDHSGAQTTQLIRPLVFDYHIIDNNGNTALRYKAGGEYYPAIPEHFKSPLAKDFKFYKTLTDSNNDGVYEMATLADEITSSFAAAGIQESADIFIRYDYDEDLDIDNDNILQGRWMTISLGGNDVQASGAVVAGTGTGVSLYTGSKNASNQEWQWKFLASPSVETSYYYEAPDPYAVKFYNHKANRAADPTVEPNPMGTAIKVDGHDRFVLLSHPDGDYALAAAGDGLTYSFLNGGSMTTPSTTAASVKEDASFSTASTYDIADAERLIFNNDVTITYTYKVITNDGLLAASATQDESTAQSHNFTPYLPGAIQTPLLNQSDYQYYGTASESAGVYTVVPASELQSIYGLYDNVVYVRYNSYNELNSPYKVPNAKGTVDSHVARGSGSNDTSLGLNANLLYNIIWYNDEMMKSSDDGTAVQSESDQALQATTKFEWQLEGNDPYAIKIKSVGATSGETQKYIHESATPDACELSTTATTFMILNREGYDYGVLAKTGTPVVGSSASMLSGHGETLTTSDPTHFIIFALATYKVIYHLMIKPTGEDVRIPYRATSGDDLVMSYKITSGTTQRDLTSGSPAGTTYQLGTNLHSILTTGTRVIGDSLYCVDAGCISLGAKLEVPEALYRPNVVYEYFIEGVYNADGTESVADMNTKYRGLESTTMGDDAGLLGKTVLINIVYSFDGNLETNQGEGFVTSVGQNKWYTFETSGSTPYLAHYTNAWGLQSMAGRATRFTNDYLWTPLGDAYGFKMYNRYMCVNSQKPNYVMTTTTIGNDIKLKMGEPDGATIPYGNEIYELLASGLDGYFYVHPVINKSGTQYYVKRKDTSGDIDGDGQNDLDYAILSTTPTPWTFGLNETLFAPYYERAGYLGCLTDAGKALYETAAAEPNPARRLMNLQGVVYDAANIIAYTPGFYRLHNQPGVSGINPVRYASGYLHDIERTAVAGGIPMHFYSRKNVSTTFEGEGGLASGFTETAATRGAIPVPATEYDPSTIFYFPGSTLLEGNPRSTMSTQGLYVKGADSDDDHGDAVMTATPGEATTFSIMDIGAGTFLIHDGSVPASRKYFHFSQSYTPSSTNMIYDLKYFHNSPTDDAKWCIEPADMQGLMVATNSGGDGHFYTTFCAPFDVLLPDDDEDATYNAYVCPEWDTEIIHPKKVGQFNTEANGCPVAYRGSNKFVPAGTPVILRTTSSNGYIHLSLPTSAPTTALSCVFSGKYLEQKLSTKITPDDKVYAFGLPITGYGLDITSGSTNGDITNVIDKDQADTGVGFYLNATPNKELSEETGLWTPNNRYVLHNKIYYRTGGSGASARRRTPVPTFIPVVFDDELAEEEGDEEQLPTDGHVYDLQGRCVATGEAVSDGSWKQRVAPGIYIVNGKKLLVGRH